MNPATNRFWTLLAVIATVALLAQPAVARVVEQRSFDSDVLEVRNLIGEIKVEGHGGSGFEVEIDIQGKDASEGRIDIRADGSSLTLVFPEARRFVYPRLGSRGKTNITMGKNDGFLSRMLGQGRIEVRGSGDGVEIWADLTIRVPAGGRLEVDHGVGQVDAENVNGDLTLGTHSGHVSAHGIDGSLEVDTGSGHVEVSDIRGDLLADTGSGHVTAERIEGHDVNIDTGSGSVTVEDVRASKLRVDTGSGRVSATAIRVDSAEIDTGSGSVTLELDEMGQGDFNIDTGSGSIRLRIPHGASADVQAETGSGGVDLDIGEPVQLRHKDRDQIAFSIGSGGARVRLDTGSGSIRITH